jgi:type VI secretion system secreted protein VgrG
MIRRLAVEITGAEALDVRTFAVSERLSSLFSVTLTALCPDPDIDLDAVVGLPARFVARGALDPAVARTWSGVCGRLRQLRVEEQGLSTYEIEIAPTLWLLTHRKNHRIFQHRTDLEIALDLLSEWDIRPTLRIVGTHKRRKYRVQYGESDYAFLCRMLEDAGVSFYFATDEDESRLVLTDTPETAEPRAPAIAFRDQPTVAALEHVTAVHLDRRVRPGRYTVRDHDYRRPPTYPLLATARRGTEVEDRLERFDYAPGAFLFESQRGEDTPVADDRGRYRADEAEGKVITQKRLDAERESALACSFETNVIDLTPGVIVRVLDHPHRMLRHAPGLLVVAAEMRGEHEGDWSHRCEARSATGPYRPPHETPKPRVAGVESATVVGPAGEEIHCDEHGRVRVHFHWDREGRWDERDSCWMHVSQPWGGAGYGSVQLPRIGQEVLVEFLGGDPDRPVVVGRVYNSLQRVPYPLPQNKTQSGWRSNSTGDTRGYNEMMFEDSAGSELVRVHAEKDMHTVVKNDEDHSVGGDRTRSVEGDEDVSIGQNRSKSVAQNEREQVGLSKSVVVGLHRSTQVGAIDSTTVGQQHVLSVLPPGEGGDITATTIMAEHGKLVLDTGQGARIEMTRDTITLSAAKVLVHGTAGVVISTDADLILKGGPNVKINPPDSPSSAADPSHLSLTARQLLFAGGG